MRVVILGSGVSGHLAALALRRGLDRYDHDVVVIDPELIWYHYGRGIGLRLEPEPKDTLYLEGIYARKGIIAHRARATTIYPDGLPEDRRPQVEIEFTFPEHRGQIARVPYDYLINATGVRPDYSATPGLDPALGYNQSLDNPQLSEDTGKLLAELIAEMQRGEHKCLVVGAGHGCNGNIIHNFETVLGIDYILQMAGIREMADLIYLTNEAKLGDFAVDGIAYLENIATAYSQTWVEDVFKRHDIQAVTGAGCKQIRQRGLTYESLAGGFKEIKFDFALLSAPSVGAGLKAVGGDGADITSQLFDASGLMIVDANYESKSQDPADWPRTYQNPDYPNIFAIGSAFSPPYPLSRQRTTPTGTRVVANAFAGTQASTQIAWAVANSIISLITESDPQLEAASLAEMETVYLISPRLDNREIAVVIKLSPLVANPQKYPRLGRDPKRTKIITGRAGRMWERIIEWGRTYRAKALPGWWLIR